MRKNIHRIVIPRCRPIWYFFIALVGHLFNHHTIFNMFLYQDNDGEGWACPFCDWDHPDVASYKLRG